ncbi:carbohydrate ABC transporter permease [Nonomuraea deserti]|uniref:Carbohydrate ABC transporter permease n=1 Tax=Nonomuraea deserti TaxID=1848322 RepID=A0A4R4VP81_9ACTN|nr:carbohydrate ABC transporter permease [Nonomuraea deserti]TDD04294.1 carbohydrate ABC transporter permease [Nonomuraea deserti]
MPVRLRAIVGYVLAMVTVAPLVWLLVAVLRPADELFAVTLPSRLTLDNLLFVLTEVPIGRYMVNSAIVSVAVTVIALVLHSMAAYALARLRFPGRQVIFSMIVSTLLVSLPVILVPLFLVARELGLLDTYAGLILPAIFHAFGIFLLRQYYLTIPRELEEAADLDGCGYLRRWWQVVVPLSRPVLASLAVLFFLANWNAFLWPLTATRDPDLRVVQVGISTLQGQYGSAWNYVLAATVIAAVPTLVAFVLGQRRLVEAIKTSGLK